MSNDTVSLNVIKFFLFCSLVGILFIIFLLIYFNTEDSWDKQYYSNFQNQTQKNEVLELCDSSLICFMDRNIKYVELLGITSNKANDKKYDYTMIVNNSEETEGDSDNYSTDYSSTALDASVGFYNVKGEHISFEDGGTEESNKQVNPGEHQSNTSYIPQLVTQKLIPQYHTLADYCSDAEMCISKTNVSLAQIQEDIKSIGVGQKSIRFFMSESI